MVKILHFADAHIDMAAAGRHDPQTGLPLRVLDFLKSLDAIVDAAINERVDLVLFAGDAYRDRTPVPTFQREWGRRIMRLSAAGIPTLLLVGNHDLSPAAGRAHALQEFETLQVPHVRVVSKPCLLKPADLEDLPLQIIAIPWVSRSGLLAVRDEGLLDQSKIFEEIEATLTELVQGWLQQPDPALPTVLAAHASVQGAKYGAERSVMLGSDLVLNGALVRDPRLDYTALGHIHKAQNLNENAHPPVVYSGSIERVDFGEAADDKFFVIASVEKGKTRVEWRKLEGRRFIDRQVELTSAEEMNHQAQSALPPAEQLAGAIVRLVLEYPRAWESNLDEITLRRQAVEAFEFHLVRRPRIEARLRLPGNQLAASLTPLELLNHYWNSNKVPPEEIEKLEKLASIILVGSPSPETEDPV